MLPQRSAGARAPRRAGIRDTTIIAALRFVGACAGRRLACDIEALEPRGALAGAHRLGAARRRIRAAPAAHRLPARRRFAQGAPLIVEVLIRLPTQEFGVLASHEFLDTAERNGRMPAIDRWVIRALLVWMQRNRDRWADANAVFSVNLSGKSVVRPDFRDYLEHCLDKSGLPLDVAALRSRRARCRHRAAGVRRAGAFAHRPRLRSVGGQCRHRHGPLRFPARSERRHPQDRRLAGEGRVRRHRLARADQRPRAHGRHARHAHRGEPGGFHRASCAR